jgi:hypothetical protein
MRSGIEFLLCWLSKGFGFGGISDFGFWIRDAQPERMNVSLLGKRVFADMSKLWILKWDHPGLPRDVIH